MESKAALQQAYKDLAVRDGRFPLSYKAVAEQAGLEPAEFIHSYPGLGDLAQDIWVELLRDTLASLEASAEFAEYGVREKLLSFYFTFFEILSSERSFFSLYTPKLGVWNYSPDFLGEFKKIWLKFVETLVSEGTASGEVAERMVMSNEYTSWHWPQFMYLLNQWATDDSSEGQKTDKAIEKSVNLGFDIMGRNVLDSAFDFLKFMVAGK